MFSKNPEKYIITLEILANEIRKNNKSRITVACASEEKAAEFFADFISRYPRLAAHMNVTFSTPPFEDSQ